MLSFAEDLTEKNNARTAPRINKDNPPSFDLIKVLISNSP
jgi:hypothetical protein